MTSKILTDEEIVERIRKAAANLATELQAGSDAGLIFEPKIGHSGTNFCDTRITGQWDWYVSIPARRETLL